MLNLLHEREITNDLLQYLTESQFDFIPRGDYSNGEIYDRVFAHCRRLCNNTYRCIDNCQRNTASNRDTRPEWNHKVRTALETLTARSTRVLHLRKGYYRFL